MPWLGPWRPTELADKKETPPEITGGVSFREKFPITLYRLAGFLRRS
jgi:hypothetical protein